MNPQIERELLEEMTLFPPEQNPRAPVKRPPDVQFTEEQLCEAAERNPWVKLNIVVPHIAALPRPKPITNRQRTRGGNITAASISRARAKNLMHTDREIIEAYRAGELPALTAETIPAIAARQKEFNAPFQAAMETGTVGGNPWPQLCRFAQLPPHLGAIIAKAPTLERDRSVAIAAILKADKGRRSTLRRKSALPNARKTKAQTPVELLVGADKRRC